jgi:hypothetical protein
MKAFMYDKQYGYLLTEIEVANVNNLPSNVTTIAPDPNKVYQKFDGTAWVGGYTNEEFAQQVQQAVAQQRSNIQPDSSQQAMNTLGLQMAQLTAENKQLKQSVNQLGLQLAQVTMKDKKENGGN